MSYNSVIRSDDPQAADKLSENIKNAKSRVEYMQKVNDYFKENGTVSGCEGIDEQTAAELDERIGKYNQDVPYPGRFFKSNYDEIKQMKTTLKGLTDGSQQYKGWEFAGGEAVVNLANNRLQLMFDEKPDDAQRSILKESGFKWAPTAKAWQKPLNDKTMQSADKINFIKPSNGQRPSELQPKINNIHKKNEPER